MVARSKTQKIFLTLQRISEGSRKFMKTSLRDESSENEQPENFSKTKYFGFMCSARPNNAIVKSWRSPVLVISRISIALRKYLSVGYLISQNGFAIVVVVDFPLWRCKGVVSLVGRLSQVPSKIKTFFTNNVHYNGIRCYWHNIHQIKVCNEFTLLRMNLWMNNCGQFFGTASVMDGMIDQLKIGCLPLTNERLHLFLLVLVHREYHAFYTCGLPSLFIASALCAMIPISCYCVWLIVIVVILLVLRYIYIW